MSNPASTKDKAWSQQRFDRLVNPQAGRLSTVYNPTRDRFPAGPARTGYAAASNTQISQELRRADVNRAHVLLRRLLMSRYAFDLILAKTTTVSDPVLDAIRGDEGFQFFTGSGLPAGLTIGMMYSALANDAHKILPQKACRWTWYDLVARLQSPDARGRTEGQLIRRFISNVKEYDQIRAK